VSRALATVAALGFAFAAAASEPAIAQSAAAAAQPQIVATGEGEATTTPDRATLYVGVQSRATTAAAAAADNARRSKARARHVARGGVDGLAANHDYSVAPEMQYDRADGTPRVVRYVVTNTVRAEIVRLSDVGRLIDAALAKGANQISGVEFYSSAADEARRRALAAAVAKARADAEAMARAAGGSLGGLIELSSSTAPIRPMDMMVKSVSAMERVATPIEPGVQTVRATVLARWQFIGGR